MSVQPAKQPAVVVSFFAGLDRGERRHELGQRLGRQSAPHGRARHQHQRALKLRVRPCHARVVCNRRERGGAPYCRAVRREALELRPFERPDQRRIRERTAHGVDRVKGILGRHGRDRARGKHHRVIASPLFPSLAGENLLAHPDQVRGRPRGNRANVVTPGHGLVEHRVPERLRTRYRRSAGLIRTQIGDERRGIEIRPPEHALIGDPIRGKPLEQRAETASGRHPLHVRRIEVEGEAEVCRGHLGHRAEKVREPPLVERQQRADERGGIAGRMTGEPSPDRRGRLAAGQTDDAILDAQRRRHDEERRRIPRRDFGQQFRLGGDPRAGLIVEREQPVVKKRGSARLHDRADQRLRRCRPTFEDRAGPDGGSQRQGNGVRGARCGTRRIQPIDQRSNQGGPRVGGDGDRRVVDASNHLEQELAAVEGDAIVNRRGGVPQTAGQRRFEQRLCRLRMRRPHRRHERNHAEESGVETGQRSGSQHVPPFLDALFCTRRGKKRRSMGRKESTAQLWPIPLANTSLRA